MARNQNPPDVPVQTVSDTATVDLTLTGTDLSADVEVSPNAGNLISILGNGLFAAAPAAPVQSVADTNCIDLTLSGGVLTADPIIRPGGTNATSNTNRLGCSGTGLHVGIDQCADQGTIAVGGPGSESVSIQPPVNTRREITGLRLQAPNLTTCADSDRFIATNHSFASLMIQHSSTAWRVPAPNGARFDIRHENWRGVNGGAIASTGNANVEQFDTQTHGSHGSAGATTRIEAPATHQVISGTGRVVVELNNAGTVHRAGVRSALVSQDLNNPTTGQIVQWFASHSVSHWFLGEEVVL
jgi:hypothetical protein